MLEKDCESNRTYQAKKKPTVYNVKYHFRVYMYLRRPRVFNFKLKNICEGNKKLLKNKY